MKDAKIDSTLIFKDGVDQDYGKVTRMLGNNRCTVLIDGVERLGIICGRLRNRRNAYVCVNDTVLVSRRDYQPDKVDVIHLYSDRDTRLLTKYGELTSTPDEFEDVDNIVFESI